MLLHKECGHWTMTSCAALQEMHMAEMVLKGSLSGTSGAGLEQGSGLLQPPSGPLQRTFRLPSALMPSSSPGILALLLGSYDATGASKRKGWASVLSTHLSRGRALGSPNSSHKYLSVSAIQKLSMPLPCTAGSFVTSCSINHMCDRV